MNDDLMAPKDPAPMTLNEYQALALRTANSMSEDLTDRIVNGALGLAGEAGEVADMVKKWKFHGHVLDYEGLEKELGDILWYLASVSAICGFTLEEVARVNVEKLMKRYPNGFNSQDSINRKE